MQFQTNASQRDFDEADRIANRSTRVVQSPSRSKSRKLSNRQTSIKKSRSASPRDSPDRIISEMLMKAQKQASPRRNSPKGIPSPLKTPSKSSYYPDKQPSSNRQFDDRYWYESQRDKNQDNARRKVDELIYHDQFGEMAIKSPRKASPKGKQFFGTPKN